MEETWLLIIGGLLLGGWPFSSFLTREALEVSPRSVFVDGHYRRSHPTGVDEAFLDLVFTFLRTQRSLRTPLLEVSLLVKLL